MDEGCIGEEADKVFKDQFAEELRREDQELLDCIPNAITEEQRDEMNKIPTKEEVKSAVFSLNSESASGLDGFSGKFFQCC